MSEGADDRRLRLGRESSGGEGLWAEEEEEGESRLTSVSVCVVVCLSGFPLRWRQLEMPPLSRGTTHIILHSPPFSPFLMRVTLYTPGAPRGAHHAAV